MAYPSLAPTPSVSPRSLIWPMHSSNCLLPSIPVDYQVPLVKHAQEMDGLPFLGPYAQCQPTVVDLAHALIEQSDRLLPAHHPLCHSHCVD